MSKKTPTASNRCHIHDDVKQVESETIHKNVCVNGIPFVKDSDGKYYCLFHQPSDQKNVSRFKELFQTRIRSIEQKITAVKELPENEQGNSLKELFFDFRYVWFPLPVNFNEMEFRGEVNFKRATFSSYVDFWGATFKQRASFEEAVFTKSAFFNYNTFEGLVSFNSVTFKDRASFSFSEFRENAYFSAVSFVQKADFAFSVFKKNSYFNSSNFKEGVDFPSVLFDEESEIFFERALFQGPVIFSHSKIKGHLRFEGGFRFDTYPQTALLFDGDKACLKFSKAQIESPQQISFHTVRLQPHWFIDQENSKTFVFTDCRWSQAGGKAVRAKEEIRPPGSRIPISHALLTKTCRQLADNYEESKGFEDASMFRKIANEAKRLSEYRGSKIWSLHWWYWLSSFYGESWIRALVVLLTILTIFSVVYMFVEFQVCPLSKPGSVVNICEIRPLDVGEAVRHSLTTASFQNIESRKPADGWTETITIFEKIFAPLQAALLALAIRRKFMR